MSDQKKISYLILDTRDAVIGLRKAIACLPTFDANEGNILKLVFDLLQKEEGAEEKVEYECLDIIREYKGSECTDDVVQIANALREFAFIALEHLKQLRAYQNGELSFKYLVVINADVMLVHNAIQ